MRRGKSNVFFMCVSVVFSFMISVSSICNAHINNRETDLVPTPVPTIIPMELDSTVVITYNTDLEEYRVTIDGNTHYVGALEKAQSSSNFYNYYSSSSHIGNEVSRQSRMYYYKDTSRDRLYLVINHHIDNGGYGGSSATFHYFPSIPGNYAEYDDPEPCQDNYTSTRSEWVWGNNTDGCMLRLPAGSHSFTITATNWENIIQWAFLAYGIYPSPTPTASPTPPPLPLLNEESIILLVIFLSFLISFYYTRYRGILS